MAEFVSVRNGQARGLIVPTDNGWEILEQERDKSKAYKIVRPEDIANPLRRVGWTAEIHRNLLDHYGHKVRRTKGWCQALVVQPGEGWRARATLPPGYEPTFAMLFDNQGRHALKIRPGTLRMECTNVFHGEICWRARHDNEDAVRYLLRDPVALFERLMYKAMTPYHRLDSLHGVGIDRDFHTYFDRAKQRTGKAVRAAWREVYWGDSDMWGMVQAMTHCKRAGAQRLADYILSDEGYPLASQGRLPPKMSMELAAADVARLN